MDTFEPNPAVFADMVTLIVRGLLRRPSLSGTLQSRSAQYMSTMLWPRNVMRARIYFDAFTLTCTSTTSTLLGGDFNMSAFSTVGDVFTVSEFVALGNSLLCGLGGLDDTCRECAGFLIMPQRPYEWRIDAHGC